MESKNTINLKKVERKKFKGSYMMLIFLVFAVVSLGINSVTIFSSDFQKNMNTSGIAWKEILDSYLFIKVILNPILITAIISKSVGLENYANMWKIIKGSGIDLKRVYLVKLSYIYKKYLLYQFIEWAILIIMAKYIGLKESLPYYRYVIYFLSQGSISFLIMVVHYLISLKWENQLITTSVALIGTLVGLIGVFLPKNFSVFIPYSWYAHLMNIHFVISKDGSFLREVLPINYLPLVLSLVLGIIILNIGKRIMMED